LAGQIEGPTYYPGVTDRAKATILTVTSGDVSEVQDFVLARMSLEYKVSGHVKRPQGDNSALLGSVLLTRETLDPMPLRTSVANDGSFELLNVPPGDYSAKVQVVSGTMLAVSVHVIDSDIDGIELLVPRQLDIKGRVVTKGSEAIPQLFFRFEPDAFGMVAGPVPLKPDGTFELRIPEGIRFTFVGFPPAYAIESVTYGSQNLLKEPLVKGDGEMIVTFGPALRR
jgi:hypothetical protein